MKFELYGVRTDYSQSAVGGDFEPDETRDLVATFDAEDQAKAYVLASRLKNQTRRGTFQQPTTFRKASLLADYDSAEIEQIWPQAAISHNPSLDFLL